MNRLRILQDGGRLASEPAHGLEAPTCGRRPAKPLGVAAITTVISVVMKMFTYVTLSRSVERGRP